MPAKNILILQKMILNIYLIILQHPWMVSVQDAEGFLHCGGSIVASNRIVTAAHCFTDFAKNQKMSPDMIQKFHIVAGTDNPFEPYGK